MNVAKRNSQNDLHEYLVIAFGSILVSSVQRPILDLSGHDDQLTLLSGALFSLLSIVCLLRLQARTPSPGALRHF